MHGTLLLNTDSSVMARYLQVSKAKMQAKEWNQSVQVANLIELNDITPEKISESLKRNFQKSTVLGKPKKYTACMTISPRN